MPSKEWKRSERNMADMLGGRRVPITGRQRGSAPDIEHDVFAIEHKYGQRILSSRLKEALEQAQASADHIKSEHKLSKIPLVTFEEKTAAGYPNIKGVFMTVENFIEFSQQGWHFG